MLHCTAGESSMYQYNPNHNTASNGFKKSLHIFHFDDNYNNLNITDVYNRMMERNEVFSSKYYNQLLVCDDILAESNKINVCFAYSV